MKRTFPTDFMLWLFHKDQRRVQDESGQWVWPPVPDVTGYEVVESALVDTTRWSTVYRGVFRDPDGTFWQCGWRVGATEVQDESPWEYDNDVTCTQVVPVDVVVTQYVEVEP